VAGRNPSAVPELPRLARCPGIVGRGGCRLRRCRGGRGKRGRARWCARRRGGSHRRRCWRARGRRNWHFFACNGLLRRRHSLQTDVNRIGGKLRRSTCAVRLGSHGHRLRVVAAQCECHRELTAGLHRELTGRATDLTKGGFRFRAWRFGFNGQRLGLRSGFEEIQARHRCRTPGQHQARCRQDNNSAHDPTLGGNGHLSPEHDHRTRKHGPSGALKVVP